MCDIRHRVGIAAPQSRVFAAFTTADGLTGFWTRDLTGDPTLGGSLEFYFGSPDPSAVMDVIELDQPRLVRWRCVAGPDEWRDTTLAFELATRGDETEVLFTHAGWSEQAAFMHHCSTKWGYFLLGLKRWLDGGASVAYPNDVKISNWG